MEEIKAEFKEVFNLFDSEGEGFLTQAEFSAMIKTLGMQLSSKETQVLWDKIDTQKTRKISFEPMLQLFEKAFTPLSIEEKASEVYAHFDPQGLGVMTGDDLARVMREMGEDISNTEGNELLRAANHNSEKLTKHEFISFLISKQT